VNAAAADGMGGLPPLPEGTVMRHPTPDSVGRYYDAIVYTAEQMHEYARATLAAAPARLTRPAQVHHTGFQAGLPESTVVECAQRHYEWRQVGPGFYPPGATSQQQLVRDEVVRQPPQRDRDAELRDALVRAGRLSVPADQVEMDADAWAELHRLRAERLAPDGRSWYANAVSERLRANAAGGDADAIELAAQALNDAFVAERWTDVQKIANDLRQMAASARITPRGQAVGTNAIDSVELLECFGEPTEGGICWCQYRREHGAEGMDR
jgi:hypothetical protein